ncbi:alpha-glucan family phosphorylase [Eoetvoesiella caeni]|uniref:Starch phosphorylase n=1 Tax=Eoetvoesiella caeni TaxID=645616 RepID=A0A366HIW6_9BURK|nr:alpha-glucan family phosphorylase [Eoetvoesiella caeni]MCI2807683.1 alpha-glucan family phosphorylase [Eoetvoesiella caeni]NYT52922.1 alpha-glucan family phosphorylase [Eoetvoesiella caeni]RBP42899.1 starch phosphorylase [Eoetvoesiella caeni]
MAETTTELDIAGRVAYFSMEMALEPAIPTYAGGLGVLAGDVMRSAADLELPVIGITLVSRAGYFKQEIGPDGGQIEKPATWRPEAHTRRLGAKVAVHLEGRQVWIIAWLYFVSSVRGASVPVLLLDTNLEENHVEDRTLTDSLYGGDAAYRLKQEAILGIGGVRMLRALAVKIRCFHMNEGHSAFMGLESRRVEPKARRIFTTHTPVDAGHDRFPYTLVTQVLGDYYELEELKELGGSDELNMTRLSLSLADYVNGVARRHAMVSQRMFPGYEIKAVTNGVHPFTWTSEPFRALYSRHWPGWSHNPEALMRSEQLASEDIWNAHMIAKAALIRLVQARAGSQLEAGVPILGLARRMTEYKRIDLLFRDLSRLKSIANSHPFQVVLAGKSHPHDAGGKRIIERLHQYALALKGSVQVAFIPDYDMEVALAMVSGADVWLNTPLPPHEASGTSGMKAAFNGVPNLSILDGWWLEGCIEGITGWAIGNDSQATDESHAASLYDKLEHIILPMWYRDRGAWVNVMRGAIGRNANHFNSQRMMRQYAAEGYLL